MTSGQLRNVIFPLSFKISYIWITSRDFNRPIIDFLFNCNRPSNGLDVSLTCIKSFITIPLQV